MPRVAEVLRAESFPLAVVLRRRRLHDLLVDKLVSVGAIALHVLAHRPSMLREGRPTLTFFFHQSIIGTVQRRLAGRSVRRSVRLSIRALLRRSTGWFFGC